VLIDPEINKNFGPPRLATVTAVRPATRHCGREASVKLERVFIKAPPRPPNSMRTGYPHLTDAVVIAPVNKFRVGDVVMWVTPGCQLPMGLAGAVPEVWKKTCLLPGSLNHSTTYTTYTGVVRLTAIGDHISEGVIFDLSDVKFTSELSGPPRIDLLHGFTPPTFFYYSNYHPIKHGTQVMGLSLPATNPIPMVSMTVTQVNPLQGTVTFSSIAEATSTHPGVTKVGDRHIFTVKMNARNEPIPPIVGCTCAGCHDAQDFYDNHYGYVLKSRAGCTCEVCYDRIRREHSKLPNLIPFGDCNCVACVGARSRKKEADAKQTHQNAVEKIVSDTLVKAGKSILDDNTAKNTAPSPQKDAYEFLKKEPVKYEPPYNAKKYDPPKKQTPAVPQPPGVISAQDVRNAMPPVQRLASDIFSIESEARELCRVREIDPNRMIYQAGFTQNPKAWKLFAWQGAAIEILEFRQLLKATSNAECRLSAATPGGDLMRIVAFRDKK